MRRRNKMALLKLDINGEGFYHNKKLSIINSNIVTLDHIVILTQIRSGDIFRGEFNNVNSKITYIMDHVPLTIEVGGGINVVSLSQVKRDTQGKINRLNKDMVHCFKNDNNNASCLVNLASLVNETENQLIVAGKSKDRQRLTNALDDNITKFIKKNQKQQAYESQTYFKQQARNREIKTLGSLNMINNKDVKSKNIVK
jgi:hypothetical protein